MKHTDYKYNIEYIEYDADSGVTLRFCDGTFISYGVDLMSDKPTLEIYIESEKTRLVVLNDEPHHGLTESLVCLIAEDRKIIYNPETVEECKSFHDEEMSYTTRGKNNE